MYLLLFFTFRADPNIGACDNDYDIDIGNMQEMKIFDNDRQAVLMFI